MELYCLCIATLFSTSTSNLYLHIIDTSWTIRPLSNWRWSENWAIEKTYANPNEVRQTCMYKEHFIHGKNLCGLYNSLIYLQVQTCTCGSTPLAFHWESLAKTKHWAWRNNATRNDFVPHRSIYSALQTCCSCVHNTSKDTLPIVARVVNCVPAIDSHNTCGKDIWNEHDGGEWITARIINIACYVV